MKILGIETSCDETAVAILEASGTFDADFSFKILGNALLSQAVKHKEYGGVFPNLAKREHGRNLVPLLGEALRQAAMLQTELKTPPEQQIREIGILLEREQELYVFLSQFLRSYHKPDIDCIAVTAGPGLEPALWVGVNFAKALSHVWSAGRRIPIVATNHMEGHILISALSGNKEGNKQQATGNIEFPMLSLLISGGHTELILSRKWQHYEYLGRTRDDAVGEAFDKTARLLGLDYPGGPEISKYAEKARISQRHAAFKLPRPMLHSNDYDFSFAGLKTAVRNLVLEHPKLTEEFKEEVALEFENTVADVLIAKTMRALDEHDARTLVIGGGVSANTFLRKRFADALKEKDESVQFLVPPPELATDNAVMIALAGYFRALKNEYAEPNTIVANGSLKLS